MALRTVWAACCFCDATLCVANGGTAKTRMFFSSARARQFLTHFSRGSLLPDGTLQWITNLAGNWCPGHITAPAVSRGPCAEKRSFTSCTNSLPPAFSRTCPTSPESERLALVG
uniref:Putative secreted protein n=1 Tax=Ixodes ricinus TaxID=34613 RepID=A0A6B0UKK9_IXORI